MLLQLRTIYYVTMAAVEDEETQRKGIVGILYNICEKLRYYNACTLLRSAKLRNALPARYVAMHYFHNDPSFMEYVNFELCHLDAHTRARNRIHHGESFGFAHCTDYLEATFGLMLFSSQYHLWNVTTNCCLLAYPSEASPLRSWVN